MLTQTENKTISEEDFALLQRIAKVFYASGMFPDIKSHAQTIVKVMAGKELGLPPFASITGIHVVQGKPVIGANLIATMIANHPTYNYRITKSSKEICEVAFYDSKDKIVNKDTLVGNVSFTIQEAQEAGLLGKDNWKKYAADMLFARAISRGAKRYTPGIFGGTPVYTPDEMDVDVDEDGVIVHSQLEQTDAVPAGLTKEDMRLVNDRLLMDSYANKTMAEIVEEIRESKTKEKLIPGSDETIIEEIKKTHVINEEFR